MAVKLSKADMSRFSKDPRKFLSEPKNAAKLAGITAADKNRLAAEISKVQNVSKSDILKQLDKLAVVSVSAIDW